MFCQETRTTSWHWRTAEEDARWITVYQLTRWSFKADPQFNLFLNRSSKWSFVSRVRTLEEEKENSKDGNFFDQSIFLSLHEAETLLGYNWPSFLLSGTTATKTAFAKTSCTKAKEETGIVSLLDRLVSPLALRLRMSVSSQRQDLPFEDIWWRFVSLG